MFSFSHFSVSKWKFQSLPRKEVLLFEAQKPWSEQWNQSVSHLPLQGGSWQARTDSGFSPAQWSPALQRTCLTSVPSPQVTEHYRNKGCDYRCLFHQDCLSSFPHVHTQTHTWIHEHTRIHSSGVLSLWPSVTVTWETENPSFTLGALFFLWKLHRIAVGLNEGKGDNVYKTVKPGI